MSGGEKLGHKHELAITALLSRPTITQAAATIGIGEPTAWQGRRARVETSLHDDVASALATAVRIHVLMLTPSRAATSVTCA